MQGTLPPRRMRYSWESRCRFVRLVKQEGLSPERAAVVCGAHRATGYRWLARLSGRGGKAWLIVRRCRGASRGVCLSMRRLRSWR